MIRLLSIGAATVGSDGYRGEVRAAVIDPVAAVVTHLVVEPEGRSGLARLVPLGLVETEPTPTPARHPDSSGSAATRRSS